MINGHDRRHCGWPRQILKASVMSPSQGYSCLLKVRQFPIVRLPCPVSSQIQPMQMLGEMQW